MATMPPPPPQQDQPPQGPPGGPPSGPPSTQYVPAQPGAPYAPTPAPAYAPQYAAPTPRIKRRTAWMTFAQVLMILKGIVWLLFGLLVIVAGIYLIINGSAITSLPRYSTYFGTSASAVINAAAGVIIAVGFGLLVIGIVGLILGIICGRPSNGARWVAIVLTVLAALVWVAGLINGLSNQQSSFGWLVALVFLATDVIIFYGLALDPNTRRAYAGRP